MRVAWDGRSVGGGGVERGGGGVPGLPVVPPALDCEGPALGMLYDAGGHRGKKGGVNTGTYGMVWYLCVRVPMVWYGTYG